MMARSLLITAHHNGSNKTLFCYFFDYKFICLWRETQTNARNFLTFDHFHSIVECAVDIVHVGVSVLLCRMTDLYVSGMLMSCSISLQIRQATDEIFRFQSMEIMSPVASGKIKEMRATAISWHGLMIYLIFNQVKQFITSNFLVRRIIENNYGQCCRKTERRQQRHRNR